jgi:hypothetical protein
MRSLFKRITSRLWTALDIGYRSKKSERNMKAMCRRVARRKITTDLRKQQETEDA